MVMNPWPYIYCCHFYGQANRTVMTGSECGWHICYSLVRISSWFFDKSVGNCVLQELWSLKPSIQGRLIPITAGTKGTKCTRCNSVLIFTQLSSNSHLLASSPLLHNNYWLRRGYSFPPRHAKLLHLFKLLLMQTSQRKLITVLFFIHDLTDG